MSRPRRLPQFPFQKGCWMVNHHQSEKVEQIPTGSTFQDWFNILGQGCPPQRGLDAQVGSPGCLPYSTCIPPSQEIPKVSMENTDIPVPVPACNRLCTSWSSIFCCATDSWGFLNNCELHPFLKGAPVQYLRLKTRGWDLLPTFTELSLSGMYGAPVAPRSSRTWRAGPLKKKTFWLLSEFHLWSGGCLREGLQDIDPFWHCLDGLISKALS